MLFSSIAPATVLATMIQAPTPGTPPVPHDNDRSYKYTYDPLNRLKIADGAVTIKIDDRRMFQLTRHNFGPLGSAILDVGSMSDDELDRIWCKYAGSSHRPC